MDDKRMSHCMDMRYDKYRDRADTAPKEGFPMNDEQPTPDQTGTTHAGATDERTLHELIREVGSSMRAAFAEEISETRNPRAAAARVRERVLDALTPEQLAATTASLEAVSQALGGSDQDDTERRGFGPRRGFGFGPGRGFGRGNGFGPHRGFDPHHGFGPHRGFAPEDGFGPRRDDRRSERAFERGFEAGYRAASAA